MGAAPGDRLGYKLSILRTGRPWPDRMGGGERERWGGSGAANMLEKRGKRVGADGG